MPVDDTIARVISRLDPLQFQHCFLSWMTSVSQRSKGAVIALDGQVLRGSYNRDDRASAIVLLPVPMVSC
ncbi:hypothetical protein DBR09_07300 [Aeromonas sp. HMWF016]|nr:hypothetical protein DBR09_07300 [Aeromonas sp. HMWF016]